MKQASYLAKNAMSSTPFISFSSSKLLVSKFITCHLKTFYSSQTVHYNNKDYFGHKCSYSTLPNYLLANL